MKGTKEYYEMMENFEKFARKSSEIRGCRFDREGDDSPNSVIYEDGYTNALFHVYMVAYQHGRSVNV